MGPFGSGGSLRYRAHGTTSALEHRVECDFEISVKHQHKQNFSVLTLWTATPAEPRQGRKLLDLMMRPGSPSSAYRAFHTAALPSQTPSRPFSTDPSTKTGQGEPPQPSPQAVPLSVGAALRHGSRTPPPSPGRPTPARDHLNAPCVVTEDDRREEGGGQQGSGDNSDAPSLVSGQSDPEVPPFGVTVSVFARTQSV